MSLPTQASLRDLPARARWEARTLFGRWPRIALPVLRARADEGSFQQPLRPETRLVIEGFPRTGNTFAMTAFRLSQSVGVPVAHHTHMPAQVLAAVRAGVPVLVLIREPEPTVLSLAIRLPFMTLAQGLRSYARFYGPLVAVRDRIVLGTFEELTTDLGGLIGRVNERFGTSFDRYEGTPSDEARVMAVIEEGDARRFGTGESLERSIARPSELREGLKEQLRAAYRGPELAGGRDRAERVYRALVGGGPGSGVT